MKLKEWQKTCVTLLKNQTDRKVLWIVDREGNSGKSWLCKYLYDTEDCNLLIGGSNRDVSYTFKNGVAEIVVFDFCRSYGNIPYRLIESLKNGFLFSEKYESKVIHFESPKVLICSNRYPDWDQLSKDRWEVHSVTSNDVTGVILSPVPFEKKNLELNID